MEGSKKCCFESRSPACSTFLLHSLPTYAIVNRDISVYSGSLYRATAITPKLSAHETKYIQRATLLVEITSGSKWRQKSSEMCMGDAMGGSRSVSVASLRSPGEGAPRHCNLTGSYPRQHLFQTILMLLKRAKDNSQSVTNFVNKDWSETYD